MLSIIALLVTAYPGYRSYDPEGPMIKFALVSILGLVSFLLTRRYCSSSEEFQINRLRRYLTLLGVLTFFFSLFVMDPPDSVVERGWMDSGLEPALWGGLFVNLILATAGGVLGLGIGVILAFGRQSELPIFKWPSTALIETVRAGPMIAWLYFAKYLLEGRDSTILRRGCDNEDSTDVRLLRRSVHCRDTQGRNPIDKRRTDRSCYGTGLKS